MEQRRSLNLLRNGYASRFFLGHPPLMEEWLVHESVQMPFWSRAAPGAGHYWLEKDAIE